jgi:16S rRNA (guanine966-N2)-methyltransferase
MPLAEPRGVRLRPTSGLVREALFNIVGDTVEDAAVLDLFAGSGALGIEALSRGAKHATFVEADAGAVRAILDSLGRTGFTGRAKVLRGRLPGALASVSGPFDLVFLDPPYDAENIPELLGQLRPFAMPAATIVYEHASRYNPPEHPPGLILTDRRVYGDSALGLYVPEEGE